MVVWSLSLISVFILAWYSLEEKKKYSSPPQQRYPLSCYFEDTPFWIGSKFFVLSYLFISVYAIFSNEGYFFPKYVFHWNCVLKKNMSYANGALQDLQIPEAKLSNPIDIKEINFSNWLLEKKIPDFSLALTRQERFNFRIYKSDWISVITDALWFTVITLSSFWINI